MLPQFSLVASLRFIHHCCSPTYIVEYAEMKFAITSVARSIHENDWKNVLMGVNHSQE